MGRVDHRQRRDYEPVGAAGADRGAQAVRGGQPARLADEFGAFIGDQPGGQRPGRLGAGPPSIITLTWPCSMSSPAGE